MPKRKKPTLAQLLYEAYRSESDPSWGELTAEERERWEDVANEAYQELHWEE